MQRTIRLSSFLLLAAVIPAQGSRPTPDNTFGPGWRWELAPLKLRDGFDPKAEVKPKVWAQHGESSFVPSGLVSIVLTSAGNPVLTHVRTGITDVQGSAAPEYRPVLFTASGEKLWSMMSMGAGRGKLGETRYVFPPPKDPGAIASYALGVLDLDGKRERAKAAEARVKDLGASVLPLPLVGEKLEFDLPTLAGERFKSSDQLGKVLVIDSWATW